MKLCWETLEHLILLPGIGTNKENRLLYYNDIENLEGRIQGNFDISKKPCLYCNEYFLTDVRKEETFCDSDCRKKYNFEKNKYKKVLIDKRLKENGGGRHMKYIKHKSWNKGMKYGTIKDKIGFNTFKDKLSWFVEVRPDPENKTVLQTKCCICNKWFSPNKERAKHILAFANGTGTKHSWGFYCSTNCESKCPYFGKTVKTIIKNDYLNSGKAKYSEVYNIPDTVLYYDWQDELQKVLNSENNKYKKRQLRRRNKRTKELERIRKRKLKRKIKEDYLKSDERKKELRLKRNLYLSKHRAKILNIDHDIDYDWLVKTTPEKCPKCGVPFSYDITIKMNPFAPSIDRIDSNKGYTKDNCQVVSWIYNCGKNCYTEEDLYIVCKSFLDNIIL